MNIQARTTLGIEISTRHVAMALVRRERRRFILVRAAKVQVSKDLIKDGQIQDIAGLSRAIRQARAGCLGMFGYAQFAGISLPCRMVRLHLLDLPDPLPVNLGSYVREEVGESSNIPADRTVSDYGPIGPKDTKRLLAAIADAETTIDLIRPCAICRLAVQVVEPTCLAAMRALQPYLLKSQVPNSLIVMLDSEGLALGVFRGGHLDFVRYQPVSETSEGPDVFAEYLASQIRQVIQFYTVESASGVQPWRICLLCQDRAMVPTQTCDSLVPKGFKAELEILKPEDVVSTAVQCQDRSVCSSDTSLAALGLALGLLGDTSNIPRLNLLPQQVLNRRKILKQLTIVGLLVALMVLAMALIEIGLVARIKAVEEAIAGKRAVIRPGQAVELANQQRQLEARIAEGSRVAQVMQELVSRQQLVDWAGLLEDLRRAAPISVTITQLTGQAAEQPSIVIDGYAVDYPSVRLFVERLEGSNHVASASLVRSGVDVVFGKTQLAYQIRCILKSRGVIDAAK